MPYSIPTSSSTTTTPVPKPLPLPIHSQGRPGHRRSFSYTQLDPSSSSSHFTGTSASSSGTTATTGSSGGSSSNANGTNTGSTNSNANGTPGAFASLGSLPTRRKSASFHLAADDDDDSSDESPPKEASPLATYTPTNNHPTYPSSSGQADHIRQHTRTSSLPPVPVSARFAGSALRPTPPGKPTSGKHDDEDDEAARGLPPLKLKIPSALNLASGTTAVQGGGALGLYSPGGIGAGGGIPFPRTASPSVSREGSSSALNVLGAGGHGGRGSPAPRVVEVTVKSPTTPPVLSPLGYYHGRSNSQGFATPLSPRNDDDADSRPGIQRTTSSSMLLLANGKPLKSSLKGSSSSPHIPFPAQSLVPSRYQHHHHQHASESGSGSSHGPHTSGHNQRHIRAASAPALPNFDTASSSPSTSTPSSPPPEESEYPQTAPTTPSAPKAVHFPSTEEGGLTSIRIFKRTAKPVSLLIPGASGGEETETETDGEGYNSAGGGYGGYFGGFGGYSSNQSAASSTSANQRGGNGFAYESQWNTGGYSNPWDRYTKSKDANANANGNNAGGAGRGPNGYPFPKIPVKPSPLGTVLQGLPPSSASARGSASARTAPVAAKNKGGVKKRIVYEIDDKNTSAMPKRDLGLFDNVFMEGVELVCLSGGSSSPGGDSSSSSSSEDEDPSTNKDPQPSSKLQATLHGSLLVRNVSYEKHVTVRFTLDDWHTTSEVKAVYRESLGVLGEVGKWVLGDRSSPPSNPAKGSSSTSTSAASPPLKNPQWDRFEFSINLSDYARSKSLSGKVLWMVVRYNVPGEAKVPVPVVLPPFLTSGFGGSKSAEDDSQVLDEAFLARSNREMVELVANGLVSPSSSGTSTVYANTDYSSYSGNEERRKMLKRVEQRLKQLGLAVGLGTGNEWWDNNASGNYRIGFRELEVEVARKGGAPALPPIITDGTAGAGETLIPDVPQASAASVAVAAARRRNVLSSPPMFMNATPPGRVVSPPQLNMGVVGGVPAHWVVDPRPPSSGATTLPEDKVDTNAPANTATTTDEAQSKSAPASTTIPAYEPKQMWPSMTARRVETSKAMAETTLERLKRLNLRNYAAPAGPTPLPGMRAAGIGRTASSPLPMGSPSVGGGVDLSEGGAVGSGNRTASADAISSTGLLGVPHGGQGQVLTPTTPSEASTNESTPLTSPLHTPTMGSVEIAVAGEEGSSEWGTSGDKEKKERSDADGKLDNIQGGLTREKVASLDDPHGTPTRSLSALSLGGGERLSPVFESGLSSAPGVSMPELGTSPPFSGLSDVMEGRERSRSVSPVASTPVATIAVPAPATGTGIATPLPLQPMLKSIMEKSMTSPPRSPGGSGRNSPAPGLISPSASSSTLSALAPPSGTVTPAATNTLGPIAGRRVLSAGTPGTESPLRFGSPSASGSGSDSATGSSSTASKTESGSGADGKGSRSGNGGSVRHASHGHHHHKKTASSLGHGQRGSAGGKAGFPFAFNSSVNYGATATPPTSPILTGGPANGGMGSRQNSLDEIRDPDSIYQAFVKQWCFASGPTPAQGGGYGSLGGRKA